MNRIFAAIVAAGVLLPSAQALADCKPACSGGQVCRYEAAGGKFYCADPVGGAKGVGGPKAPAGKEPAKAAPK